MKTTYIESTLNFRILSTPHVVFNTLSSLRLWEQRGSINRWGGLLQSTSVLLMFSCVWVLSLVKVFQVDRLKNALVVTLSIQVFVQADEVLHSARDFFRHRKL